MLSIAIWEAWECCDFRPAAHFSLLVSGESGGIAGAPLRPDTKPQAQTDPEKPKMENSVVHFTCNYYSNYFSSPPLFQTRSDPCCCLCATGYGQAEWTAANRRAVVGDVYSHVMCCEVFRRNDTLRNGEVNCYSSPLNLMCTRCTLRMQMTQEWAGLMWVFMGDAAAGVGRTTTCIFSWAA